MTITELDCVALLTCRCLVSRLLLDKSPTCAWARYEAPGDPEPSAARLLQPDSLGQRRDNAAHVRAALYAKGFLLLQ